MHKPHVLTLLILGLLVFLRTALAGVELLPFQVTADMTRLDDRQTLDVRFEPAPDHYIYADSIGVFLPDGRQLEPLTRPEPVQKLDPILGEMDAFYDQPTVWRVVVPDDPLPEWVEVRYLGCNPTFCYPPAEVRLALPSGQRLERLDDRQDPLQVRDPATDALAAFEESARGIGYMGVAAFGDFLDVAAGDAAPRADLFQSAYQRGAMWLLLIMILAGGLALNLTPCVLPMIPVNLAIIGAGGGKDAPRGRGFSRGLLYGLGMTLVYGALGLIVMLAGVQFGALNASWIFNLFITLLFVALALAMFDVFTLDFSRYQFGLGQGGSLAGGSLALVAGGVAALLAGACVAPVVISVLLLSADIFAAGHRWGLLLPFALGAGMALPWPFAGAGLSVLPKPGAWMNRVKQLFGILILLVAAYYGLQAFSLARQALGRSRAEIDDPSAEVARLEEAARLAQREGKPLLIDFWATWCTSCMAMKRTTFQDPEIKARLENEFVFAPFQAEQPDDPVIQAVLRRFDILGFPTYLALKPEME